MRAIALAMSLSALAASPAFAQQTEPEGQSITVTAARIQSYRDRLAACLARHCPVNEDVDATMALTEVLFLEGQYEEARATVRASLARNRHQAARYPEPVADLHRVVGRMSSALGFDRMALQSTHRILNALHEGLPQEDHRHFTARLEIAEAQLGQGRLLGARRTLAELERHARAAGREDVAIMAELRHLWYDYIAYPYGDVRARIARMARLTEPTQRLRAAGAKVLLARIYQLEGDEAAASALLAELGRGNSARRRVIYAPPYQLTRQETAPIFEVGASTMMASDGVSTSRTFGHNQRFLGSNPALNTGDSLMRLPENMRSMWIDIGFWVMPDGSVAGLELLRHGADPGWADPLLESVRGRRYSTAPEPSYRVERYTYTSRLEAATGTRGTTHSPRARAEYFDLTDPNQPTPPPPTPPASRPGGRPTA